MNGLQSKRLRGAAVALFVLALLLAAVPVSAQDNGVRQDGNGKYANLTAQWWAWALSQPAMDVNGTNTNPILDTTGAYGAVGQENGIGPANKYFFLAGTFGFDATRTLTVPAGKTLFFPVVNFEADNAVDPPTNNSVPQLRELARAAIDANVSRYATVDGKPVEMIRVKSPVFSYTLPDENSIYDYVGLFGPQFEGTIAPTVSDGYWSVIPPLAPGEHTVTFGAAGSDGFQLNVVYHLTVQ